MTYVKTYALMDAWASAFPRISDGPCAVCEEPILGKEVCYYVTQLDRDEDGNEQPVCWRHIRPDMGPLVVA